MDHIDHRLHDAALAFDDLLVAARRHGLAEHPDAVRALGTVVHAIAASITPGQRDVPTHPGGPIGSVLLDRAAARFSTRVVGTEVGRRPSPPSVLTALDHARRSLEAAGVPSAPLHRASDTFDTSDRPGTSGTAEPLDRGRVPAWT